MIRLANRLGVTIILPSTVSMRRVPFAMQVPSVANAHGYGSVVVGPSRLQARQFSLSGSIYYPIRQQIRDAADAVLSLLQHPPIEVFQWPDTERRLFAYPQGMSQDWMDAGAELGIDIPMMAPDPYWYGAEATETETNAGQWTVQADGTAPSAPVVQIVMAGAGQDVTMTNTDTGQEIAIEYTFATGDVVMIDTGRFDATLTRGGNTEPINDALNDGYIAAGFALQPGDNELSYTGPQADVTLTYRPRWY